LGPEAGNPPETIMADLVFIVARTELKQYLYLKHFGADEPWEVLLDRRTGERRRSLRAPPSERRRMERRRHRDITQELRSSGWALVRLVAKEESRHEKSTHDDHTFHSLKVEQPSKHDPAAADRD
jgi:hypothetical protein